MKRNFKRMLLGNKNVTDKLFKFTLMSDTHIIKEAINDEGYPSGFNPPMFYYTIGKKLDDVIEHVNIHKPPLIIHLGDAIDGPSPKESYDYFYNRWSNEIDSTIKKSITAGNHDYTRRIDNNELGLSNHEYVAEKLGYGGRPYTAGSKMQESFAVYDEGLGVRFINVDTNKVSDGTFSSDVDAGYLHTDALNWIETELLNCPEKIAFVYSHKGRQYLNNDQNKDDFYYMLSDVKNQRPELKIYRLYGHSHIPQLWEWDDIDNIPLINCSALVDNIESQFYTFYISEAGIHSIETHWARYE